MIGLRRFLRHRYDYRAEWLRFTRTMGQGGSAGEALPERAIRAIAEMTESAGGLLFMPEQDGTLVLAARWHWPAIEVPGAAFPIEFALEVERTGRIVDIGEARGETEPEILPMWLAAAADAWALVPLLHLDRLHGVIVLAHPSVPRQLDREDVDLLGIVGRQLASYLAERAGQEALMEARQFDEFSRRIAFVMHDVKNLASQLSLLARNAERHADNPAFRADMLVTLRNSADKLNALLARLGRYGASGGRRRERVELRELAARVKDGLAGGASLNLIDSGDVAVLADAEALEQALVHLVQNAVEAGEGHGPVYLDIASDGVRGRIDVIDSGGGMSAEFIRDGLFRPFVSSKPSGFGIGAFEARELVRAMGGRLDVDSREGIGTRFSISLPLFAAAELIRNVEAA
ncbi:XrtA/PEP-CTERM system histidine kinase PrsK [Altererythrobacter sp. C41]|uniref:XrtA/PEP-CTERM system histidine kinase PrsK n=1 Tax=Altererythrobacter sp. C41 TaxID=2806021 RepID=UPI00193491AF|nr:XrtA/PEP-CTERM system histidine kinase PrsK [Altererythrobacter sp. C41]MBM0168863.1 PEP-CTERM system histidine kinase PrsK [Altererythrobacter sp. C41]